MKRSSLIELMAVPFLLCCAGRDPFREHLDEYVSALSSEDTLGVVEAQAEPYINGKVLLIDKKGAEDFGGFQLDGGLFTRFVKKGRDRVDALQRQLPESLRAESPEEVGTVVWLTWGATTCWNYTGGLHAYAVTCDVVVIDYLEKRAIAAIRLGGVCPEIRETTTSSFWGPPPDAEVLWYVSTLGSKTLLETIVDSVHN